MNKRFSSHASTWHAQTDQYPTLLFSKQAAAGFAEAFAGSYLLCFPGWYRIDDAGRAQLLGRTWLSDHAARRAGVSTWRQDLERCLDMPLPADIRPYQARIPAVTLFNPYALAKLKKPTGRTLFPPHSYVHLGPFLYSTDAQGLLHPMGECSPRNAGTPEAFQQVVHQLTGIKGDLYLVPKEGKGKIHD